MAIVVKDRVKETTTTTGQGTVTLLGAVEGYVSFNTIGNGNTTYYTIYNPEDGSFEVGIGTYTASGTTLSRDTVLSNSLGTTAKISFTAGTKDVFCTYPAEKAIYEEPDGQTLIDGGPITVLGAGVTSNPSLEAELGKFVGNVDSFGQVYNMNQNDGSSASADFVVYNDLTTDGFTHFTDMGINSSNYSSVDYPIFTPGSGYFFHDGDNLFVGTQTANKDVVLFAGGVDTSNEAVRIKGSDQSVELASDLTVAGTATITGAATFGSTVLLNADPTIPLQAATKQYVDQVSSSGLHIHQPVRVERGSNLTATYTQGGTTFNVTDIAAGTTLTTSTAHGLSVNDQVWFTGTVGNGLSANVAYFVYSVPSSTELTLSTNFNGAQLTGLTNASGLTYPVRANSGEGATLTNAGAQAALVIDGITLSANDRVLVYGQTTAYENGVYVVTDTGSGSTNWVLTRALDQDHYSPSDTNGMGSGDYFYVTSGNTGAGESYVLTTDGEFIIGYTALTYTQFSASPTYVGGTNIDITGQTISLTGTVAATNGGTGTNTVTTGDLLYGSASNTWSKLAAGSAYKSLVMNAGGTNVEWNAVALNQSGAVSGSLGATNGGTGQNAYATGDMLYSDNTNSLAKLSGNTSTTKQFLTQTGTGSASQAPAWGTISGSDVTSAVSSATNVAGGAANKIVYQTGSSTTGFIDAPVSSNTALIWNGSAFAWGSAGATITDDTTTNTNYYPVWANSSSGSLTTAYVSSSKMTFNPSTGTMTCTAFSGSGASLTSLNASNLSSGTVGTARLGSGTASSSTYLRGDGTWSTVSASPAGSTTQVQYNNAGAFAGSANLTFNGTNLTCGGTVTANSDESLKTNWRDLPADFVEQLAKVKHGTYDRVDLELTQDGVSAQSLQNLLPNSVLKGEDGKLSVAYGNAALVAAIKLAERVVQLEAIVAKLTKE